MDWADERLGERIKNAYAYQQLLQQNGWVINGTDFPIEDISPIYTFYAAVARKHLDGTPAEGFQMENALTREQALRSITIWVAKGCFLEARKGSIEGRLRCVTCFKVSPFLENIAFLLPNRHLTRHDDAIETLESIVCNSLWLSVPASFGHAEGFGKHLVGGIGETAQL